MADRLTQFCEHPLAIVGHNPKPYRCPICYGRGHVPHDFYNNIGYATATNPEKCRSCGGRGIVFA